MSVPIGTGRILWAHVHFPYEFWLDFIFSRKKLVTALSAHAKIITNKGFREENCVTIDILLIVQKSSYTHISPRHVGRDTRLKYYSIFRDKL